MIASSELVGEFVFGQSAEFVVEQGPWCQITRSSVPDLSLTLALIVSVYGIIARNRCGV